MPSPVASSSRRRRVLPRVAIVLLLACLIALVVFAIVHDSRPVGRFSVSGDPIDMKLIGVRPDLGEELFDPSGKLLPEMALPGFYCKKGEFWRDFIITLPEGHERLLICDVQAVLSVKPALCIGLPSMRENIALIKPQKSSFRLYGELQDHAVYYGKWPFVWRRTYPTDYVDLHVFFFGTEPRGKAEFTFTGPFLYSKGYQESSGRPATIRFDSDLPGNSIVLNFGTPLSYSKKPVLIYDTSGRKHMPEDAGGDDGVNGANLHYFIRGLYLNEIAMVTVGETPREKVFHNVQVTYPGQPEQTRSSAVRALEARIGPDGDLTKLDLSSDEALDLIDVLEGRLFVTAVAKLLDDRSLQPQLTQATEWKVHSVAERLVASADPHARSFGVMLGLKYCGTEFVGAAVKQVFSGEQANDCFVASALSERAKDFTPQHIARIKDAMRKTDDPQVLEWLFECLCRSPACGDSLWELAQDDRPWLWLPALSSIPQALGNRIPDDLPLKMRTRIGAIEGFARFKQPTASLEKAAADLLLSLLTPELARMSDRGFGSVFDRIREWPDRAAAIAALIRFLDLASREPTPWFPVYRVVRQLNEWNGTDIGGNGAGYDHPVGAYQDWQLVAADAVEWYRTGVDPGSVQPAIDNPGPDDIRVVFTNISHPARSVSGIWIEPRAGVAHVQYFRIKQGDITFFYCLTELKLNCRFFAVKGGLAWWEKKESITGGLPASIDTFTIGTDKWECRLEPLDQPSPNLP